MSGANSRDHAAFAALWAQRIVGTSYVPMSLAEIEEYLLPLTYRLTEAVAADPFSPAPARKVGRALVDAHFTSTQALLKSGAVLADELLAAHPSPDGDLLARISALQGEMGAGFAEALQELTLREQQAISRAAFVARDAAARAQRASEARFGALFAGAAIGIAIADGRGRVLDANQALLDMLGYHLDELSGRLLVDFFHADDVGGVEETYTQLLRAERDHVHMDRPLVRRDGNVVWTHLTLSLIPDEDEQAPCVAATFEDVTDRHLLESRLRYLATHDPLTQLPNRALLLESMDEEFRAPAADGRIGLCFLDLDGFKVVNDSFGHGVGDRLLVEIAGRLDKVVSTTGHMVARMGGDEFIILVAGSTGPSQVIQVADRALAAVSAPLFIDGHELSLSASVGIVERLTAGTTPADLLRAADITLYWAKSAGKGRWALFDPLRNACEVAQYTLSASMPAALSAGEFFLEYQPVVRFADGALVGLEALVRWRHPRSGVLGPERFMGLAEETGMIAPLGRWIIATACEQVRAWQRLYPSADLFVSINLGSGPSHDPRLVADIGKVLVETGMHPSLLQLELTRDAVMDASGESPQALRQLSAKGIRIALRDFGPGYSNFTYLRGLPVRNLKVTDAFVGGMHPSAPDQIDEQIVKTLVTLAHTLGLTVTAEGVDTPGQADRLRSIGADYGQGDFLSRPGSPEKISALLAGSRTGQRPPFVIP